MPSFPAKRALDKFSDGMTTALLRIRDDHHEALWDNDTPAHKAFDDLYYSYTPKNFDRFAAIFPPAAAAALALKVELVTLQDARKVELAEKARKAAKRVIAEAKAANITSNGVKLGIVSRDTFETLNACLAEARAEYVKRIIDHNLETLAHFTKALAEAGTDRELLKKLMEWNIAYRVIHREYNKPPTVSENAVAIITNDATRKGNSDFDAYVIKLGTKIGAPVATATLVGSLWNGSILTVTLKDGSTQIWNTKMILNFSVYGTPYNQWPTTRAS